MKQQSVRVSQSSARHLFHPLRSLLLTLLFLPAVGLHQFWDLRTYTGGELALLTGRPHSYSYRHTERFLLQLSAAQIDQALTEALARWTAAVCQVGDKKRSGRFLHPVRRLANATWLLVICRHAQDLSCAILCLLHILIYIIPGLKI